MSEISTFLFGAENHVSISQEAARAVLIFVYGLAVMRLGGRRAFGHWSALDIVVTVVAGSALARAMTGTAPLAGTLLAVAVLCLLHVTLSHAVARNPKLGHFFEGKSEVLIDHGQIDQKACERSMVSKADLDEALRQQGLDIDALSNVKLMTLEPSGKLSVVKLNPCKRDF